MATPAELAFERTNLDEEQLAHLQRLLGHVGDPGRPVLLRPGAPGADGPGRPRDRRRRPRAGDPRADAAVQQRHRGPARPGRPDGGRRPSGRWSSPTPSRRARCPGARCCSSRATSRSGSTASRSATRGRRSPCWPGCPPAPAAVPGHLERTYRDVFERFAVMLAESTFPFPSEEVATEEAPRVGDGVVLVDEEGRVRYASPNATNALHRMGMYSQIEGRRLYRSRHRGVGHRVGAGLGPPGGRGGRAPARRDRAAPLHPAAGRRGRDRLPGAAARRDRRPPARPPAPVQGRGHPRGAPPGEEQPADHLGPPAAAGPPSAARGGRVALFEAERRVRSIAIVHEILSREPERPGPLRRDRHLADPHGRGLGGARRARDLRGGRRSWARCRPTWPRPLAVVLAELAAERRRACLPRLRRRRGRGRGARRPGGDQATIRVRTSPGRPGTQPHRVEVTRRRFGLPEGFDIDETQSLGLSIVRDLVRSQLDGTITMRPQHRSRMHGTSWHRAPGAGARTAWATPSSVDPWAMPEIGTSGTATAARREAAIGPAGTVRSEGAGPRPG